MYNMADPMEEIEIYDPDKEKSVSAEKESEEIDSLRTRIEQEDMDLDARKIYSHLSESELHDARYTARRACLEHNDFSKYSGFLVNEILEIHFSRTEQ